MHSPQRIVLVFLALFLGVAGYLSYFRTATERSTARELTEMLSAEHTLSLGPRTKSSGCRLRGALPDPECTPGAVFPDATREVICVPGYSKTVRNVPQKLRKELFAAYGFAYPPPSGAFELDHLIPLALGGNNAFENLFPEPAEPVPGFREKDLVEIYLHEEVCAGRADLNAARNLIAKNWLAIYERLTPEEKNRLKAKFRSWLQ